ncbi:MAG: hypothetical protein GX927_02675 [Lentisphaerae bacterium]|nr:hypothetical protein [Lentisphaerota bacterium]
MVEPISTTAAVAAGTSAATSATEATAVAGAIASPPITLNKVQVLRNLAKEMLLRSEMIILDQSELVEEFAAPIYAGIAATVPNLAAPAKVSAQDTISAQTEVSTELPATSGKQTLKPIPDDHIIILDGPIPQPKRFPMPNIELLQIPDGLSPEVSNLLTKYYEAPTIESQMKSGASKIVVERNLLDQKVMENGNKKTAICWIEERVIDKKYLGHGNLTDMISQIRHGQVPTIRQVYLAMIDLMDLATFKLFNKYLVKYKLEASQWRVRQLSADIEKKTIAGALPETKKRTFRIEREVEERSSFKPDHVTVKKEHEDTEIQKSMDLITLNVKDVCTVNMSRTDYGKLGTGQKELVAFFDVPDQIVRMENNLNPDQIAKINKQAMVWTKENILATTRQYTSEDHFNRYLCDLKAHLGNKYTESAKEVSIEGRTVYSEYISPEAAVNLTNINTFEDAAATFDKLHRTATIRSDNQLLDSYIEPGKGVKFQDGWITYVPGGSIVNLALKSDLGVKLNKWDWIWAGVDVATIALAIVTWGGASAASKAATTTAKGGTKVAGKATVRGTVKISSKAGSKAASRVGGKTAAKAGTKHTGKVTLKNVGAKAAAKNSTKAAAKVATKTGFKPNTTYIRNGYKFFTDAQGRVVKATGKLKKVPGVRNPANQKLAAGLGKIGDEGGHLIPAVYGGPGSMLNHVPQTRTVNRSIIKRIENDMGRALKAGHKVEYTIMPHYPNPGTLRPDKFTIRYKIDNVQTIRRIPNV